MSLGSEVCRCRESNLGRNWRKALRRAGEILLWAAASQWVSGPALPKTVIRADSDSAAVTDSRSSFSRAQCCRLRLIATRREQWRRRRRRRRCCGRVGGQLGPLPPHSSARRAAWFAVVLRETVHRPAHHTCPSSRLPPRPLHHAATPAPCCLFGLQASPVHSRPRAVKAGMRLASPDRRERREEERRKREEEGGLGVRECELLARRSVKCFQSFQMHGVDHQASRLH